MRVSYALMLVGGIAGLSFASAAICRSTDADFRFAGALLDKDLPAAKQLLFGPVSQEGFQNLLSEDEFIDAISSCSFLRYSILDRQSQVMWSCNDGRLARANLSLVGDKVQVGQFLKFVVVNPPLGNK